MWVASKTGSLKGMRGDAGLVHTPRAEWALAVMTKDCPDNSWTSENTGVRFISEVSRAVYNTWGAG